MDFVLIRHTRCAIEPGVCYGHSDIPLHEGAESDIANTLDLTPTGDVIFTSSSRRCRLLAERLAARDACDVITLDDLRELNFGEWEGRRWHDLPRDLLDPWAQDTWHRAPPGGETEQQLYERVSRAYVRMRAMTEQRIAVVSHGGPLRLLRCLIAGLPMEQRWTWQPQVGAVIRLPASTATDHTTP